MIELFGVLALCLGFQEPLRQSVPETNWGNEAENRLITPGSAEARPCFDFEGLGFVEASGIDLHWTGSRPAECELLQTAGWRRVGPAKGASNADSLLTLTMNPGETIRIEKLYPGSYTVRVTDGEKGPAASTFKVPAPEAIRLEPSLKSPASETSGLAEVEFVAISVALSTTDPTSELAANLVLLNEAGSVLSRLPVERMAEPFFELEPGVMQTAAGGCVTHVEGRPLAGLSLGAHLPGDYTLRCERDGHETFVHQFRVESSMPSVRIVLPLQQGAGALLDGRRFEAGMGRGREVSWSSWAVAFRRLLNHETMPLNASSRLEPLDLESEFSLVPGATCWLEPGRVELRMSSATSETIYVGPVLVPERPGLIDLQVRDAGLKVLGLQVSSADRSLWWDGQLALSVERGGVLEPLLAKGLWTRGPHRETRFRGIPTGRIACFADFQRTRLLGLFDYDGEGACVHLLAPSSKAQTPIVVRPVR